jgi:hypothetical protein
MSTTKGINRAIVTLKLPRKVPDLIKYAQAIVTAMTGNANFATPEPTLAAITSATNDLVTAETATQARTRGAAATRNAKLATLVQLLEQLKAYIQKTADANMENGAAIIQSAGVSVKKPVVRAPRTFEAKAGAVSGSVKLVAASAAHRASYEWQYSTDGGKTWQVAPVTLQAKTTISGLTPGATVTFRYRGVTKAGEGDWSQLITFIVK